MRRRTLLAGLLMPGVAEADEQKPGCDPAQFRIALDVGHYLASPGATSAIGVSEFEYNRSLARQVLAALRNAGFTATFLIGGSGSPLRLQERTSIARTQGAALFISLHHDSVQPKYLSVWTVDGKSQNYSDVFHGYSLFVSSKSPHFAESRVFAEMLGGALRAYGLTPSLHHAEKIPGESRLLLDPQLGLYQFDDLVVLRTAAMPAVLLESAIIVNREEEQRVRSGEYHPRLTIALVSAVQEYCRTRPAK
jgi:N-acetylmuramoyl-L-alanine amidase